MSSTAIVIYCCWSAPQPEQLLFISATILVLHKQRPGRFHQMDLLFLCLR